MRYPALALICAALLLSAPARAQQAAALTPAAYMPLVIGPATSALPAWQIYLNRLRGLAGLPSVAENSSWSDGAAKHARYMVKNDVIGHSESPSLPYYTAEGNASAQSSNVMVSSSSAASDESAMDLWMIGPFHGVAMIDPRLSHVGYGAYREADGGWQMGAALNVLQGRGSVPAGVSYPVMWPGDGATTWLRSYDGSESPDPLETCPGYEAPTGAPIYLLLGSGSLTPSVTASSLARGATSLEHCVFSEATFSDSLRRSILGSRDAVIIMPRQELSPGLYSVSVTVGGSTHSWSFSVTSARPSLARAGDGRIAVAVPGEPSAPAFEIEGDQP